MNSNKFIIIVKVAGNNGHRTTVGRGGHRKQNSNDCNKIY